MDRDQLATDILKALLSAPGLCVSLADESPRLARACFTLADEMRKLSAPSQDAQVPDSTLHEAVAALNLASTTLNDLNSAYGAENIDRIAAACAACAKKLRNFV